MRWPLLAAVVGLVTFDPRGAWSDDATAPSLPRELTRLDLSVPDLPALVDLNLSTDKVTRPSTPLDFATSLANGFSADGSFHNGVAIEVSPFGLAKVTSSAATALRVSLATTAITKDGKTDGKAAVGLRWSIGAYDPAADKALRSCLAEHLPWMLPVPEQGSLPEAGRTEPTNDAARREVDQRLQTCRDRARGAHLAQSALEISWVIDGTSANSFKLTDLGTRHISGWVVGSLGWNSYSTSATEPPKSPVGIQPTVMARIDLTDTMMGTRRDVFAGVRLPFEWDSFGMFGEAGITMGDLSHVQSPTTLKTARLGGGFDYRISDGSWLGVYVGEDFGDGTSGFSFLSNVKFKFGEKRQYGLR